MSRLAPRQHQNKRMLLRYLPEKVARSSEWRTPERLLDPVRTFFGGSIPLDPATTAANPTRALRFFTPREDGLTQPWDVGTFVNPPYGEDLNAWTAKLHDEVLRDDVARPIVALLPAGARFGTRAWQKHVLCERLAALCFVRGRVHFLDERGVPQTGNPYDSVFYGYECERRAFVRAFRPIGRCLTMRSVA